MVAHSVEAFPGGEASKKPTEENCAENFDDWALSTRERAEAGPDRHKSCGHDHGRTVPSVAQETDR
jgi:hypothetical protein